jgi:hypothetical protein
MGKLGRAPGLVRYDSLDGLAGKPRRFIRGRVVAYTGLMVVGAVVAWFAARSRSDFEVALLRLPGAPFTVERAERADDAAAAGDRVVNAMQLHLVNKRAVETTYRVESHPAAPMTAIVPMTTVVVPAMGDARVPLFLSVPRDAFHGDVAVGVVVTRADDPGDAVRVDGVFLGPSR